MNDTWVCLVGLVLSLATLGTVVFAVIRMPRTPLFKNFADLIEQWRNTRSFGERLYHICAFIFQYSKTGFIGLIVAVIGCLGGLAVSLCGTSPESMRILQAMLDSILEFLRDLLKLPKRVSVVLLRRS